MPDVHHADSAGEVQVHVPVDIRDRGTVGTRSEYRNRMRKGPRNRSITSLHQRAGVWPGNVGANANHAHKNSLSTVVEITASRVQLLLETCIVVNILAGRSKDMEYD